MNNCKTCKFFERGKWHKAIDPNEGDQLGGYCAVLDKIIGMNNSFTFGKRIYIQETFGCIAHRRSDEQRESTEPKMHIDSNEAKGDDAKQESVTSLAKDLRLFVWTDFCPDYTGGLAFAIAENEVDAQDQIEKEYGYPVYSWGDLTIHQLTKRVARCVTGGS